MEFIAKDLDGAKEALYALFNKVTKRGVESGSDEVTEKMAKTASELAEKIVVVERAAAEIELLKAAKDSGRDIEFDLDKRTVRSFPGTASKVKTLG